MHCPSCDKALCAEAVCGQTVDRCPRCDGVWLDQSGLAAVLERYRPSKSASASGKSCREALTCAKCGGAMTPLNYAYDSGVFINRCASCGGVWLESGQLDLLARYRTGTPAIRALADAFDENMRSSNRWQLARRVLRSRLLSGIVFVGYLLVAWYVTTRPEFVLRLGLGLLFPMVCIWIPDAMGNLTGIRLGLGRPTITHRSPGDLVALGGWIVLLCPAVVAWLVHG